ncbi:hypothetical protein L208DRAFT_350047 [Tricholoma matsutake]|nr:hypothetical protein L208DRAFT_350047 [Tricholoma matsutake 945]
MSDVRRRCDYVTTLVGFVSCALYHRRLARLFPGILIKFRHRDTIGYHHTPYALAAVIYIIVPRNIIM